MNNLAANPAPLAANGGEIDDFNKNTNKMIIVEQPTLTLNSEDLLKLTSQKDSSDPAT
jgi:hypothetical protein